MDLRKVEGRMLNNTPQQQRETFKTLSEFHHGAMVIKLILQNDHSAYVTYWLVNSFHAKVFVMTLSSFGLKEEQKNWKVHLYFYE